MDLALFPPSGLAGSVVTTVFLGTLICCFFNLRLGWSLQGMITPGYLAPLALLRPLTAAAIVVEAVLTALVVWLLSNRLSRLELWSRWFGRELFLLVLGTSVVVRIIFDGWLLPELSLWLSAHYGVPGFRFDSLHSFGLIVVALFAYQLLRTGGVRGLLQVAVTTGLTLLVIRWLLAPLTSFSLGDFRYLYEDVAYTLLGSPKSYIILLVVAFYASHVNLRYGWDFHGILIPAFIALQWYEPWRIVSSLVEAALIYGLGSMVLRYPRIAAWPPEGARKIAIFMSVGYAYKWLLGWLLPVVAPGIVVQDFYGFGYLITTLLAIKMQESGRPYFLSVALVQTTAIPVVLASLIGFGLQFFPEVWTTRDAVARVEVKRDLVSRDQVPALLRQADLNHRRFRLAAHRTVPLPREQESFRAALKALKLGEGEAQHLERARQRLADIGYEIVEVDERFLLLRPVDGVRDWGVYVLDRFAVHSHVIAVPAADRWRIPEAAWALVREQNAAGLALSARPPGLEDDHHDCFELFLQRFGEDGVTVVAAEDPNASEDSVRQLVAAIQPGEFTDGPRRLAGQPVRAHLRLQPATAKSLALRMDPAPLARSGLPFRTRLARETEREESWARRGSNDYREPTLAERIWLEEMVVDPLLNLPDDEVGRGQSLRWIAQAAGTLGYELEDGDDGWLLLREAAGTPRRHWGWFAFRERGDGVMVSVPRPLSEPHTIDVGLTLVEELNAAALTIAAAHPEANADGAANHLSLSHVGNAMNVVQQAWLRRTPKPALLAQVRGFGHGRGLTGVDVLTSLGSADIRLADPESRERQLVAALERMGLRHRRHQGAPAEAGLEPGRQPLALFLRQVPDASFAMLWFSPEARAGLAGAFADVSQQRALAALGAPTIQTNLVRFVAGLPGAPLPETTRAEIRRDWNSYRAGGNINALRRIQLALPSDTQWRRVEDTVTHRAVLLALSADDRVLLLLSLHGATRTTEPPRANSTAELARQFLNSRAGLAFFSAPEP